jgi:hypothetical protein
MLELDNEVGDRDSPETERLRVINNHRARMLLSGVVDTETLKYFSELVGEEEVKDRSDPDAPGPPTAARPARSAQADQARAWATRVWQPPPGAAPVALVLQRPQAQARRMTFQDHGRSRNARSLRTLVTCVRRRCAHELVLEAAGIARRIVEGEGR